jgi:predicted permease
MRRLLARLAYLVASRKREHELDEEIELHRLMLQEDLEARGLSRRAAAAQSRRTMGNMRIAREDARGVWISPAIESLWQDTAYAFRTVIRQPGFSIVAVAALAAGIGLNTSIFSIYNAVVLREWPVRNSHEVVAVFNMNPSDVRIRGGGGPWGFSLDEVAYFSSHSKTFSGFVVTRVGGGDKSIGEDDAAASWVSGNYFSLLGVEMARGRGFLPEEDRTDAPSAVAILSYGYWQRKFGGDESIVGARVSFEDVPFTILGVTARSFKGTLPNPVDIWMPLGSSSLLRPQDSYVINVVHKAANCCSSVAGRLKSGVTLAEAEAELTLLDRLYRGRAEPGGGVRLTGTQFTANPKNDATGLFTPMFAGSMLVLFIACANVGNLLIARAAARRREIGIRLSIGAGRSRIVRQLVTESLVLATIAGIVGLTVAMWLPAAVVRLAGADPGALQLTPDGRVLAFTVLTATASAILFGLLPAFHGVRAGAIAAIKDVPLKASRVPIRGALLALQVAIAIVLLACAALVANAVRKINAKDLGFFTGDLTVISIAAPARGFDAARTRTASLQLAQTLDAVPGVALTSTAPMGSGTIKGSFKVPEDLATEHFNSVYEVSPQYFNVLRIPILAGRPIGAGDAGRPVIVVNQALAVHFWKTPSAAIGRFIVSEGGFNMPGQLEVVGVAGDVHNTSLTSIEYTIYQPLSGRGLPQVLVANSSRTIESLVAEIGRIDPALRPKVSPWAANIGPKLRGSFTAATMGAAMGMLALVLAAIGIFAVFAYWVQQRTHEIGVRMALGAQSGQVVRLLLQSSVFAMGIGLLAGVGGAAAASRLLRSYMFGLSPVDPVAYLAALVVVAIAGALATYAPARRATRVDPAAVLRCD